MSEPVDLHECSDGVWRAGTPIRLTQLDADGQPTGLVYRTVGHIDFRPPPDDEFGAAPDGNLGPGTLTLDLDPWPE